MATLKAIRSGTSTVEFDFHGQEIEFTYKLGEYTADYLEKLGTGDNELDMAAWLVGIITDWNLYDDKEQTKKSDIAETMPTLPLPFLSACFKAIAQDGSSGEETGSSSFAG